MKPLHEQLDARLVAACTEPGDTSNACLQSVQEHFSAGGSRVRAHICLDAGHRLGLTEEDALCAATVCELLHNASLVQDDLLDRTPMRRNAPSLWARHGDAVAVCSGDLMLSAAYGVLAQISNVSLLPQVLRLVHQRTRDVILGQAAEASVAGRNSHEDAARNTFRLYEQQARGKSASLLSLSLELPLLLSGNSDCLPVAHAAASDFAVAYQIADDLDDRVQDEQEGASNLVLMLVQRDGLTAEEAIRHAVSLAMERLDSAQHLVITLPSQCGSMLQHHAQRLRQALDGHPATLLSVAGA